MKMCNEVASYFLFSTVNMLTLYSRNIVLYYPPKISNFSIVECVKGKRSKYFLSTKALVFLLHLFVKGNHVIGWRPLIIAGRDHTFQLLHTAFYSESDRKGRTYVNLPFVFIVTHPSKWYYFNTLLCIQGMWRMPRHFFL